MEDNTINNTASVKRKGRLKKGQKVAASGLKTMDIETAFKSIEGLKYKIANKYKVFCDSSVGYDDLIAAANIGIAWAYRDWDANTAKFTTFAHNRIERQIDLHLCDMLPRYKNNIDAKNWLRKHNESYQDLIDRKKTADEEFNAANGLDGIKPFTKEHYNLYTQKTANKLFNNGNTLVVTTSSGFQNSDHQDFNIFDTMNELPDDDFESSIDIDDIEDPNKKKIVELLLEGYSITEIARQMGVSKSQLIKMAGVKEFFN